jgi:leucyl aminopeptidase
VLLTGEAKAIEPALAEAEATALVRDLVNTPAEDMGPAQVEAEAEALAKAHKADFRVTQGDTLEREYPMVHMVGRAAARSHAPRMIELEWGDPTPPRGVIGKGCFGGRPRYQPSSRCADETWAAPPTPSPSPGW